MNRIGLLAVGIALLWGTAAHAADTVYYIHTDALGSPVAMTDANRNVVERTQYAPYGQVLNRPEHDGPGYTGHEEDSATGLTNMQQRYDDKVVGRFLSVDPVQPDGSTGASFNRYAYANDNPYRYTDPDGRYTCDKSVCAQIKAGVGALKESEQNLQANPRKQSEASATRKVIRQIGPEGQGGPHYASGELKGGAIASSDQKGTTTIDTSKISGADSAKQVAAAIGHEAQHDIDAQANGVAGNTNDRSTAAQQFTATETNAYKTENAIMNGFGTQIDDMKGAINGSVQQDLKVWDNNHPASPSSGN